MPKFSFIFKSFSLVVFIFFTQNALAQGQQKPKAKPQLVQSQPEVKAPIAQNTNPTAQEQQPAQTDFSLDERKKEIEKIKAQEQKIAEKIRSLTPEQRQVVKDEIRRHRETMKDLLGDAWQNSEPAPYGLSYTSNQPIPQPNAPAAMQNQNNAAPTPPAAPQTPNNSAANPPLPPMPNINASGKSPNQLPKLPTAPAQR